MALSGDVMVEQFIHAVDIATWIAGAAPVYAYGTGGRVDNLYHDGAAANIAAFHEAIAVGRFDNATAVPSVRSTLSTILGRTAAYEKRQVTWDELLKSGKKLDGKLEGLKD